jgi:[acyl-carrier-protein] S-malonyltransferase
MPLIFMFPSQSSWSFATISRFHDMYPACRAVLAEAADVLGRDLQGLFLRGQQDGFTRLWEAQLTLFLASSMVLRLLDDEGIEADASLGCSLGEYNHLVHIGALSFAQTLRLLEQRCRLYEEGPDGARIVLFPVERPQLEEAVSRHAHLGVVEIAGEFTPKIFLVGGESEPVIQTVEWLEEHCPALQSRTLEFGLPIHSSVFRPVGERHRKLLETVEFSSPKLPYCPGVLGKPLAAPSGEDFIDLLARHSFEAVLWRQSIDALVDGRDDVRCLEVGPGNLLTKQFQIDRTWHPDVSVEALGPLLAESPNGLRAIAGRVNRAR